MTVPPSDWPGAKPSAQVDDSVGVQVGSGNTQNFYRVGTGQRWPVREGAVPLVADCYQAREASVLVEDSLDANGTVVLVPAATTVVAGMGGVGKTQIAAHHVRPLWCDPAVDVAVWVTAADRDAIVSGYARTAHAIGQVTDDEEPARAATALLNWMATTNRRWVVVVDDLQDPEHMTGLWPPHRDTGYTAVTTRRRDAALRHENRRVVEVTPYSEAESLSYLRAKLADHPAAVDGAVELVEELDHLPLALAQAVAYILDAGITCADYRDAFRCGEDVTPDSFPDEHRTAVNRTWELSIERADGLKPPGLARPLLELLSLLAPNGIPTELVTSPPVMAYLAERVGREVTQDDAKKAVRCLHRLSLVGDATEQGSVSVHALVQRATRTAMHEAHEMAAAAAAAHGLVAVWPDVERDGTLAQNLRSNAAALYRNAPNHLWRANAYYLLFRYGQSLGNAGLVTSARGHFDRLRMRAYEELGPDHRRTLTARAQLAYWQGASGDVAGAVGEFDSLLSDQVRVLGADHLDPLITRQFLAFWRGSGGDVAQAVTELDALLTDELRILGKDHPTTLTTRGSLARWRGECGDVGRAVVEFERLLVDYLRVLGEDHPETLTTRHNLAFWRGSGGDLAGARAEFEWLLTACLRVLGEDHPETLTTRANLARWRGEGGDAAGAVVEFEQLLTD
jgi:hypothetical protein